MISTIAALFSNIFFFSYFVVKSLCQIAYHVITFSIVTYQPILNSFFVELKSINFFKNIKDIPHLSHFCRQVVWEFIFCAYNISRATFIFEKVLQTHMNVMRLAYPNPLSIYQVAYTRHIFSQLTWGPIRVKFLNQGSITHPLSKIIWSYNVCYKKT